jgi:hypothetical protein
MTISPSTGRSSGIFPAVSGNPPDTPHCIRCVYFQVKIDGHQVHHREWREQRKNVNHVTVLDSPTKEVERCGSISP